MLSPVSNITQISVQKLDFIDSNPADIEKNLASTFKISTFQGKVIRNLIISQINHQAIKTFFYKILDTFLKTLLSNKMNMNSPEESTARSKYLFARASYAKFQMMNACKEKEVNERLKKETQLLKIKINNSQTPKNEIDSLKKQLEDLNKNPESNKARLREACKNADEQALKNNKMYSEWKTHDYLLNALEKIQRKLSYSKPEQLNAIIEDIKLQLEYFPIKDLTDIFSTEKDTAKALNTIISALKGMTKNYQSQKDQLKIQNESVLKAIFEKRVAKTCDQFLKLLDVGQKTFEPLNTALKQYYKDEKFDALAKQIYHPYTPIPQIVPTIAEEVKKVKPAPIVNDTVATPNVEKKPDLSASTPLPKAGTTPAKLSQSLNIGTPVKNSQPSTPKKLENALTDSLAVIPGAEDPSTPKSFFDDPLGFLGVKIRGFTDSPKTPTKFPTTPSSLTPPDLKDDLKQELQLKLVKIEKMQFETNKDYTKAIKLVDEEISTIRKQTYDSEDSKLIADYKLRELSEKKKKLESLAKTK